MDTNEERGALVRYRTRMILLYTVLVLLLSLSVGIFYYNYSVARFYDNEQQSLSFYAEDVSRQFDSTVRMMDLAIDTLIYDIDVVEALRNCAIAGRNSAYPDTYRDEALSTLHSRIYESSYTDFYRVIIFNRYGDVVANRHNGIRAINPSADWQGIPWLDKVTGTSGKNVLIGLHQDDWGRSVPPMVYSYVKEVQGNNMGYIEVQYEETRLQEFLQAPEGGVQLFLFYPENELLYASHPEEDAVAYAQLAEQVEQGVANSRDNVRTAVFRSDNTGVLALAVLPGAVAAAQSSYIIGATALVSLVFGMVSIAFVYLISRYLTKPIEQLDEVIRHTGIDNIGQPIEALRPEFSTRSILEIDSLLDAYQNMTERLARVIDAEREATRFHMKAQFDALQAQVNPHFLFNVLNVISQRGMNDGDDMICEICANLAAILRYSTNTCQPMATVGEEITYLSQYAFLQKSRYQHMFDCEMVVDEEVRNLLIPRLAIQQIVENSIHHGYGNTAAAMQIRVAVRRQPGVSVIEVCDDGQGFSEESVTELHARFAEIRHCVECGEKLPEMEIGGMGLLNIYARLCLIFGDRFKMDIKNDGGACVTLFIYDASDAV